MLKETYGNIIDIEAEMLINSINAYGRMGSLFSRFLKRDGVSESIHYSDPSIEKATRYICKSKNKTLGDVFLTAPGKLNFQFGILHVVTEIKQGDGTSLEVISECLKNILIYCELNNVRSVAIPLLGTGKGKLEKHAVRQLYRKHLSKSPTLFQVVYYRKAKVLT